MKTQLPVITDKPANDIDAIREWAIQHRNGLAHIEIDAQQAREWFLRLLELLFDVNAERARVAAFLIDFIRDDLKGRWQREEDEVEYQAHLTNYEKLALEAACRALGVDPAVEYPYYPETVEDHENGEE